MQESYFFVGFFPNVCSVNTLGLSSATAPAVRVCALGSHFEQMEGTNIVGFSLALATEMKNFNPVFIAGQPCPCLSCGPENRLCGFFVSKLCS